MPMTEDGEGRSHARRTPWAGSAAIGAQSPLPQYQARRFSCASWNANALSANDQYKLPGRLQRHCISESRNAGPVKCNASLGRSGTLSLGDTLDQLTRLSLIRWIIEVNGHLKMAIVAYDKPIE